MYAENGPDNENHIEEEERFETAAKDIRNKYQRMMNKYQLLVMKESMVCFV